MSVVTAATRRRWAAVAVGVALLASLPAVASAATDWIATSGEQSAPAPRTLLADLLRSDQVPHEALAETRGNLGLPDLDAVGDVSALLGGTTRTRVWWSDPTSWRVDTLSATGEQGVYQHGASVDLWDYEDNRLTTVPEEPQVRLPRADDLLPPQAARRLLHGLGAGDRVTALPGPRVVAGVTADGIRVTPTDAASTIGHIDVWLDRVHHLPVEFTLVDKNGVAALTSSYTRVSFTPPAARTLHVPAAPTARREVDETPDIASRIQRFGIQERLPDSLGGLPSSAPVAGAAATYGTGLVRFAVLPLPQRLAGRVIGAAVDGGGVPTVLPHADSVAISSGVLSLVIVRRDAGGSGYVLAGMVDPAMLTQAARQLVQGSTNR